MRSGGDDRWQEAFGMVVSVFDSEHVLRRHTLQLLGCRSAAERLTEHLLTRQVLSPCCGRSTGAPFNRTTCSLSRGSRKRPRAGGLKQVYL
jgi:hypothetical protein